MDKKALDSLQKTGKYNDLDQIQSWLNMTLTDNAKLTTPDTQRCKIIESLNKEGGTLHPGRGTLYPVRGQLTIQEGGTLHPGRGTLYPGRGQQLSRKGEPCIQGGEPCIQGGGNWLTRKGEPCIQGVGKCQVEQSFLDDDLDQGDLDSWGCWRWHLMDDDDAWQKQRWLNLCIHSWMWKGVVV